MKIFSDVVGRSPARGRDTKSLILETKMGKFRLTEKEDGELEINGIQPSDHEKHLIGLTIDPKSSNLLVVRYARRGG